MVVAFIFSGGGFLLGIYLLFLGFNMYKRYQLIRDTPTSNIQSMSLGTVELKGTVREPDDESSIYKHPMEGNPECVYYERTVERYEPDDDGSDWKKVVSETIGDEFYLEDDTGEVLVKVENPSADLENGARKRAKYRVGPNDDVPRALEGTKAGSDSKIIPDIIEGSDKYRVTVEAIWPDMDLYIFGHARTRDLDTSSSQNEENIVVGSASSSESAGSITSSIPFLGRSSPFIIANQDEETLIGERKLYAPVSFFAGLILSSLCLYWFLTLIGL